MAAFGVEVAVIEKIWKATDFYLFIYIFFFMETAELFVLQLVDLVRFRYGFKKS